MFTWGELGLIQICGKNAASIDAIVAACKAIAGHPGVVRLQDFVINTDVIVLSTPEIAGLPYVISGLVAAGGLAAALSTADGLLLAIANALSHDIYYKMLDPNAPTIRRLTVARVLLFFVAVASAALAATKPGDILAMVGWAFSLAMAGNFPVIVMGIWWKRATTAGAISGMIAGFGLCLFYLVVSRYFPGIGVKYFGMTSLLNPVTGKPVIADLAAGDGAAERHGELADARASAGQQGRLVRPQQHQLRAVGDAARLPGDLRRQPVDQGSRRRRCRLSSTRSASRAGGRCSKKRRLTGTYDPVTGGALRGPASISPAAVIAASILLCWGGRAPSWCSVARSTLWECHSSILTYWYYHLPNFVLAALMYTLLGRALLGLIVGRIRQLHLALFLPHHRSGRRGGRLVTPKAAAPVVIWLFGVVWLFWLRVGLHYMLLLLGLAPRFG